MEILWWFWTTSLQDEKEKVTAMSQRRRRRQRGVKSWSWRWKPELSSTHNSPQEPDCIFIIYCISCYLLHCEYNNTRCGNSAMLKLNISLLPLWPHSAGQHSCSRWSFGNWPAGVLLGGPLVNVLFHSRQIKICHIYVNLDSTLVVRRPEWCQGGCLRYFSV